MVDINFDIKQIVLYMIMMCTVRDTYTMYTDQITRTCIT